MTTEKFRGSKKKKKACDLAGDRRVKDEKYKITARNLRGYALVKLHSMLI